MITLERQQICSGPAGGKYALCVFTTKKGVKKQLGFIQPTNLDNPVGGGPCTKVYIVCKIGNGYTYMIEHTLYNAIKHFGVSYPMDEKLVYPCSSEFDSIYT